jgi:hypothetical protein
MIQRQYQGQGIAGNITVDGVQFQEQRPDSDNVVRSFEVFLNQTIRSLYLTLVATVDEVCLSCKQDSMLIL